MMRSFAETLRPETAPVINTFTSYQLIMRDLPKALDRVESQPLVDRETKYYLENITKVKTIEEFVKNDRLFKYAMKAHGLEDMAYAKAFMVKAMKEGISDPESFANKLSDKRYAEFVKTFNFAVYGELTTTHSTARNDIPKSYAAQVEFGPLQQDHAYYKGETAHYLANISNVKSIDDLMADERILTYAMATFGLDAKTESPERVRQMLEGGVSDPDSPANKLGDKRYATFVTAFNFVEYGEAATLRDEAQKIVPQRYMAGTGLVLIKPGADYIEAETDYFMANISDVKSIDGLMADKRLLAFAMAAYGLDAATETPARVREMLTGGVADPNSPANQLTDKSYASFVAAFNFAEYGETATARDSVQKDTPKLYGIKSELGLVKPGADYVKAETDYYLANVGKLESIDDLMADKRLLGYALSSFGFDPASQSPERIREMLEGGVSDPASPANLHADKRYAAFVAAFNFMEHGEKATTFNRAQQPAVDKYIRQTLEQNAGTENEGVRLALYFERKAPELTNFYEVLADPALAQVVRTALGLPDSFASADIDRQVKLFEERLNIEDLADPEKLGDFLKRFTSLWEVSHPTATAQTSIGILFGQPVEFGVSTNVLLAIQQMKR